MVQKDKNNSDKSALPFDLDEDSVSRWLQGLPEANSAESSRQLYGALCKLNLKLLPGADKWRVLEKLRPAVFLQSKILESRILAVADLQDKHHRKISRLAIQLHRELAAGYRQISSQGTFLKDFKREQQAAVIHRALQSLAMSLLRSAQIYSPPSSKSWQEIKSLYQIAEKIGVADLPVTDSLAPFKRKSTINAILARTALFAAANPYALMQEAMPALFSLLENSAHSVALDANHLKGGEQALLLVDLMSPLPPMHASLRKGKNSERFLFAEGLFQDLKHPARKSSSAATSALEPAALAQVIRNLGDGEEHPRLATTLAFLVAGRENLIAYLTQERQRRKIGNPKLLGRDWDMVSALELQPLDQEKSIVNAAWEALSRSNAKPNLLIPCKTCLSSREGCGIVEIKAAQVGPGQLVGLRHEHGFRAAVVRWLQILPNIGDKRLGLEFIPGNASLVHVRFESNNAVPAVIVTDSDGAESLFLAPTKHPPEARIRRDIHLPEETVVLLHAQELTPFFHRFAVIPATEA